MHGSQHGYTNIDADQLEFLRRRQPILLVDIRSEAEVAQARIEGAVHIPMHLLPFRLNDLGHEHPVVLYCRSGARSAQASAFLAQQGMANIHNLVGGIMDWARSGKQLAA
ncbi:MAG: rhodanese-like domain-containing protein [Thiobacillaceae bacterium]